jgi:hypothetical protein
MTWILIVSWAVSAGAAETAPYTSVYRSHAVAMHEFNTLDACQFASLEVQKIAKTTKMVCVQKGVKP